jgi:hypothetical protein
MSIFLEARLGPDPHVAVDGGPPSPPKTPAAEGCPDVWRANGGDFAVIGVDITDAVERPLPGGASCGPKSRIVLIPRNILEAAVRDLTD